MEAVTILRELWRRRVLVAALAIVCVLIGLALTYTVSIPPESRKYEVSIATAKILVDTPDSQVVDVAPRGSDTLGMRANLFANLMVAGNVKSFIAEEAGLRPGQLQAGVESDGGLPPAVANALGNPDARVLTTRLATSPDGVLPIVELEAQAPDANEAVKLANAGVVGLRRYLDSKAATENIEHARRLRVTGLGTPQVRQAVRGPQRMVALGVVLFLFCLGCAAIVLGPRLAGSWRAAAARERGPRGTPPGQEVLELPVYSGEAPTASTKERLRDLSARLTRRLRAVTASVSPADTSTNGHAEAGHERSAKGDGLAPETEAPATRDDNVTWNLPVTLVKARRSTRAKSSATSSEPSAEGDRADAATGAPATANGAGDRERLDPESTALRSV